MIQYYIKNSSEIVGLSLRRISYTEYIVEANNLSANLKFRRFSDGLIQNVNNATLPYTFETKGGQVWEVSGDGGATYETAWGIDIPSGGYLEEDVMNSMDFPDYIYIDYYLDAVNNQAKLMALASRVHMSSDMNRWAITQSIGKVGLWTTPSSDSLVKLSETQGWSTYEMINRVYELEQSNKGSTDITPTSPPYDYFTFPDSGKKFRMGILGGGNLTTYSVPFVGKYQSYTHGTEVFKMNEGTGTQTVGSNGTVLNLMGNASWVRL